MVVGHEFSSNLFRITTDANNGRVVLHVEGWLTPSSLDLLEAACRDARTRGDSAVLELSGVRSLGQAEAQRLLHLARSGIELTGASGFVTALLDEGSRSATSD